MQVSTSCSHSELMLGLSSGAYTTTVGLHTSYTSPYNIPSSTVTLQQSTLLSTLGSALEHTTTAEHHTIHTRLTFPQAPLLCSDLPYSPCWDQLWSTHNSGTSHHTHHCNIPSSTVTLHHMCHIYEYMTFYK